MNDAADQCPATPATVPFDANGCAASQLSGDASAGSDLWMSENCTGCHGNFANDPNADFLPIDPNNLQKTTQAELADYIAQNMPSEDAPCTGQCAADVTAHFLTLPEAPSDSDADGITDDLDACANTPANESVFSSGCSTSQRTSLGQALYTGTGNSCVGCHGADGSGSASVSILNSTRDYDALVKIVGEGDGNMLSAFACSKTTDADCATKIADYIWVEFWGGTLTENGGDRVIPTAPTDAERVAAGKAIYEAADGGKGLPCATCHGADGNGTTESILDSTRDYDQLVSIIGMGGGTMSAGFACNTTAYPDCATQIADYIWVEFLDGTLTADGGEREIPMSSR